MNYQNIYDLLISRAKTRSRPESYTEKHHIIPKSLGGSNSHENIAILTAREHFIAHLLLYKIYKNTPHTHKMTKAFHMMCGVRGTMHGDRKINSWWYSRLRDGNSRAMSEMQSGSKNPNFGKRWFHNNILRISKPFSLEEAEKLGTEWVKGRVTDFSFLDRLCENCGENLKLEGKSFQRFCENCRCVRLGREHRSQISSTFATICAETDAKYTKLWEEFVETKPDSVYAFAKIKRLSCRLVYKHWKRLGFLPATLK